MMAFEAGELIRPWSDLTDFISMLPVVAAQFQCNYQDGFKQWTLLHIVVKYIAPNDVIELILSKSPDSAARPDTYGKLPLHYAAESNNSDAVKLLLDAYCHAAREVDNFSRIPLYSAMEGIDMEEDNIEVIKQLIVEFPAGIAHREKHGKLPVPEIFEDADDAATFFNYIDREMREQGDKVAELVSSFIVEFAHQNEDFDWNFINTMPMWFRKEAVTHTLVQEQLNMNISTRASTFIVLLDAYLSIAVVAVFRSLSHEILIKQDDEYARSFHGRTVFLWLTWLYLFFREVMQLKLLYERDRIIQYFDFSNIVDGIYLILLLMYLVSLNFVGDPSPDSPARIFVAIVTAVLWLQVLDTLTLLSLPFAKFVTGLVQVCISYWDQMTWYFVFITRLRNLQCVILLYRFNHCIQIMWLLIPFIVSLAIMVVAFAQMFSVIFFDSKLCIVDDDIPMDDVTADFCKDFDSLELYLRAYEMLNNFDVHAFRESGASLSLYIAYTFLLIMIVLNGVIIALVATFYDEYRKQATQLFWLARLDLAVELDHGLFEPLHPISLHIDSFFDDVGSKHDWGEGLYAALKLSFRDSRHNRRTRNHCYKKYGVKQWHPACLRALLKWLVLDSSDRLHRTNLLITRLIGLVLVPLWYIIGVLSIGLLWPPQLRDFLEGPLETEGVEDADEPVKEKKAEYGSRSQTAVKSKEEVDDSLAIIISDIAELKNMLSKMS